MLYDYTLMEKKGIFGPKFRHFCFFTKFCIYTNSKVLISNMRTVFLNYKVFSLFHNILQLDKFKDADFKYGNSFYF